MGMITDSEGYAMATTPVPIVIAMHCGTYPYCAEEIDWDMDMTTGDDIRFFEGPKGRCMQIVHQGGFTVVDEDDEVFYESRWNGATTSYDVLTHRYSPWLAKAEAAQFDEEAFENDDADGYYIEHSRATDTCRFGPFLTIKEVNEFLACNPQVTPMLRKLYKTVDWNRRA